MSTHNICFYGELRKDITELSQILLLNKSSVLEHTKQEDRFHFLVVMIFFFYFGFMALSRIFHLY